MSGEERGRLQLLLLVTSIPFHSIPFHSIPFHSIPLQWRPWVGCPNEAEALFLRFRGLESSLRAHASRLSPPY